MAYWNGDEFRWRLKAPSSVPSMTVSDLSDEAKEERKTRVKAGARVVPFGFARALQSEPSAPSAHIFWDEVDA